MMRLHRISLVAVVLAGSTLSAAPGAAQLASPSTAALGMADNYTAAARGYAAGAWNPANLGLSGNPESSITVATPRAIAGFGPVTLGDLKDYEDTLVPTSVKEQWLNSIRDAGGQNGTGGGDLTLIAVQAGPILAQVSTSARAVSDLAPGFAELILFGNADEQGNPKAVELTGSELNIDAYTTGAVSYARPFTLASGARLAIGATAKYTMGHFLARGAESTGSTTTDPVGVEFTFPVVYTDYGENSMSVKVNNGGGFGLDLGVGYEIGVWTFSAVAQNLINTFEWDTDQLLYREGTVIFSEDERATSFEPRPISEAPPSVSALADDATFQPSFAGGAMMRYSEDLILTADARFGSTEGLSTRPPTQLGAGLQYTVLGFLPIRLGAAYVQAGEGDSGFQFGGGLGLRLGPFNLSASAAQRATDLSTDTFFMVSVFSIGQ